MKAITKYIETTMQNGGTTDNRQIRKVCEQNGINLDEHITKVKEAVEIGLMHVARSIAQSQKTMRQKYDELIDLYNRQPYVGTKKTLKQMVLQQYSTPLPIAFLMSEFIKSKSNSALYFEPSAGNGFLTIALPQENTICNEIDRYRLENLRSEHYRKVTEQDGRQKFEYDRIFDGVVTNPPFIKEIDTMIFNALDTMKNNGRCAILRDGLNEFEPYYGTLHRRKFVGFYDRLFQEYNVVKIINLNSKKIYAKQGTAFFMHIILIDGRRAKKGSDDETIHRVFNPEIDKTELAGFEELWEYFSPYISENEITTSDVFDERETMRMAFNHLIKELGEDEGREVFEWYCKTYNVGISDIMPSTVKWEIFGTDKTFREIDKIRKSKSDKVSPLLEAELGLLVEVGDEFVIPKINSDWLSQNPKDIYNFFFVSYITKDGEIGVCNMQTMITTYYTLKEFCKQGFEFYKHYDNLNGLKSTAKVIAKNLKNAVINITLPTIENNSNYTLKTIPNTLADRKKLLKQELSPLVGSSEFCKDLHDNVNIYSHIPIGEIEHHASRTKQSTLAALNLVAVIHNAIVIPNPDSEQPHSRRQRDNNIEKIKELRCKIKGLGVVKLSVGEKKSGKYIAYCLTKFYYEPIIQIHK